MPAKPTADTLIDPGAVGRLMRTQFQARLPMAGNMSGHHKSPHKGSSVEFAEYRKYVPGDDIRMLDWRVYARTGALHTLAEKIPQRSLVVVFSDLFTDVDELLRCLQHLRFRKHDLAVFHLLDRAELAFEFSHPTRFIDLESPFTLLAEPDVI